MTLFPSPFPTRLYYECLELQPIISRLMLKIATDHAFLHETLGTVARVDDYTRNLLNIDSTVQKEGQSQEFISCINRSDYMLHQSDSTAPLQVRQVEMNAIACGMGVHSSNAKLMHDYIMSKYHISEPKVVSSPENSSLRCVLGGIIDAFDLYGKNDAFVLMVIEDRSINFADQFGIELAVGKARPDVRFARRSFSSLSGVLRLGPNKELLLENKEIALVYFRYGYDPSNYNFTGAWDLRLLIERSRAIKCPSINFHLSGAKKFQQVLNNCEQLERYLSADEAKRLARVSCKIWPIDNSPEGEEGFQIGIKDSRNLVLKPQREGGGHNIFSEDIGPFLAKIAKSDERTQYILMEYIRSPKEKNCLLLYEDDPTKDPERLNNLDELVSELGIYGSIIADGVGIKSNKHDGYLVRSKKFGTNEGGVASGYAGLSSLILVDDSLEGYDHSAYYYESG